MYVHIIYKSFQRWHLRKRNLDTHNSWAKNQTIKLHLSYKCLQTATCAIQTRSSDKSLLECITTSLPSRLPWCLHSQNNPTICPILPRNSSNNLASSLTYNPPGGTWRIWPVTAVTSSCPIDSISPSLPPANMITLTASSDECCQQRHHRSIHKSIYCHQGAPHQPQTSHPLGCARTMRTRQTTWWPMEEEKVLIVPSCVLSLEEITIFQASVWALKISLVQKEILPEKKDLDTFSQGLIIQNLSSDAEVFCIEK